MSTPSTSDAAASHTHGPIARAKAWLYDFDIVDTDTQRRAEVFVTLCLILLLCAVPFVGLVLSASFTDTALALFIIGLAMLNFVAGIGLTRIGHVDIAGVLVGMTLSLLALGSTLATDGLNASMWTSVLGLIIAGFVVRPGLIWIVFTINIGGLLAISAVLPPAPAGVGYNPYQVPVLGVLTFATAFTSWLNSRANREAFRRAQDARQRAEVAQREEHRAREQAELASQAKSQFLASMSHELRTPLNAIIGYSEMISEELEDTGENERPMYTDIDRIHRAGKHLLSLISNILDLSKIEAGRMNLFVEPIYVEDLAEDVVSTIAPVVRKQQNTLRVEVTDDAGIMHSDRTKLRQILLNLLSNASKFTEHGEITLTVERVRKKTGPEIIFTVEDTGIGIAPDALDRIFEDFVQAEESTTRRFGGTGLGLALCKRLAQMLGGDISVESTEGEGSTFRVYVPVLHDAPKAETAPARPERAESKEGAILVIDDDPAIRDFISRSLAREGLKVLTRPNGQEGLKAMREHRPAVVILDLLMPEMDGWETLRRAKSDPDLRTIPIILATILDERESGFSLGASDYLVKPIERDRLLQSIDELVAQGEAPETNRPRRALVVDDQEDNRVLLKRMLRDKAFEIDEASNGVEALDALSERAFDIILLDLMMPKMDGFEVLHRLRRDPRTRHIPVIIITAKKLDAEQMQMLREGATEVLFKGGFGRKQLLREIQGALTSPPK